TTAHLDDGGAEMQGDEDQLVGLVTNLLLNAIEAQPAGGRILITTRSTTSSIECVIADDGPGVPAEVAERIFKPFFSAKHFGTGLGLAMSLVVARDHGGTIELVDPPAPMSGAAFRISLTRL